MFSLFNFSSIFPVGGQLTPFAPMCGRPWRHFKQKLKTLNDEDRSAVSVIHPPVWINWPEIIKSVLSVVPRLSTWRGPQPQLGRLQMSIHSRRYAAPAAVDRYLLHAPELRSTPATCWCYCRSTGQTDRHRTVTYSLQRILSGHRQ